MAMLLQHLYIGRIQVCELYPHVSYLLATDKTRVGFATFRLIKVSVAGGRVVSALDCYAGGLLFESGTYLC